MTEPGMTLGELIAHRKLAKENRAGVPQYATGQHAARMLADDAAVLTFVDAGGHVCVIPCLLRDGEWCHMGASVRVGQSTMQVHYLTIATFNLSDKMKGALSDAAKRYEAKQRGKRARTAR